MNRTAQSIKPGSHVTLHYSLTLADGTLAVSTFDEAPMSFTLGDGTMEQSLEQALIGLIPQQSAEFVLSGDETFGPATADKIQHIPRGDFPAEMDLEEGQLIAFTTPAGDELAGTVLELNNEDVVVDFNHPLSGQLISFKVKILEVVSPDESS